MFFRGCRRVDGKITLTKIAALFGFGLGVYTSSASAGVITFDDFSSSKPNVSIRANPIDTGSTATTSGVAGDYWTSRTFRIVTTTGGANRTLGFIDGGRLEIANADGISSRVGLSWSSQNVPSGITAWTMTAELLSLDTGTVTTAGGGVTRLAGAAYSTTLVTLGSGTALAAINNEFFIDSGPSSDFTLDNVKLNYTCKTVTDTSSTGIVAAVGAAGGGSGDGCQSASVPLPSTLLLLCLSALGTRAIRCRKPLQTI